MRKLRMKHSTYVAVGLLAIIMLVVPACDWFQKVPLIVEEPSLRILDINTEKIFNDAHIPGAIHVSLNDIEKTAHGWNRATPIVTYCSDYNCMASHKVAQDLVELGFTDVSVYAGGISEWYKLSKGDNEGYVVEGPAQLAFLERDVEILDPDKKEKNRVTAEQVLQLIQQ